MKNNKFKLLEKVKLKREYKKCLPKNFGEEMLNRKFEILAIYDRGYSITYLCRNLKTYITEEIEEQYLERFGG